jgi:hypothetical protein
MIRVTTTITIIYRNHTKHLICIGLRQAADFTHTGCTKQEDMNSICIDYSGNISVVTVRCSFFSLTLIHSAALASCPRLLTKISFTLSLSLWPHSCSRLSTHQLTPTHSRNSSQSHSQSYFTTCGLLPISSSWRQAPWDSDQMFSIFFNWTLAVIVLM